MSVSRGSINVAKCTEVFLARASRSTSALSPTSDSLQVRRWSKLVPRLVYPLCFLPQELASLLPVALECVPTRDVIENSVLCRRYGLGATPTVALLTQCDIFAVRTRWIASHFLSAALSAKRGCFFFLAIHGIARAAGLFSFSLLHLEPCLRDIRLQEDCRRYLTVGVQHPFWVVRPPDFA